MTTHPAEAGTPTTDGVVNRFVAAVRDRLRDLPVEEQQELTDGLTADLADQVAERGPGALGDPEAYARELRLAAGFSPVAAPVKDGLPMSTLVHRRLDAMYDGWVRAVGGLPGDPWPLLVSLRPVWWVLRAWVAVQLIDLVWGNGSYNFGLDVIPSLQALGAPLLVVAIIVSVQLGRGRVLGRAVRERASVRLLLLALNLFAVVMLPVVFGSVITTERAQAASYQPGTVYPGEGLAFNGQPVDNIYPYGADGAPLLGVQLVDEQGRRLAVNSWSETTPVEYLPWRNGATEVYSVFPLTSARVNETTGERLDPVLAPAPFAELPPVTPPTGLELPAEDSEDAAPADRTDGKAGRKAANKNDGKAKRSLPREARRR